MRSRLSTTRPCIAASSTTVKLLTVSTLKTHVEDSVIFWHSKISSGVLERPIPKSDSRSRDSWHERSKYKGAFIKAAQFHQCCSTYTVN